MESIKKSLSFSTKINQRLNYQPINQTNKTPENFYKNEIQQIIKDIEDSSKSEQQIFLKHLNQFNTDELRQRLKDQRVGQTEHSLLHLSAKYCRSKICLYLISNIKLDKDVKCKSKSTPFQYLIKSNIFHKNEFLNENNLINVQKKIAFKETFNVFIEKNCDVNHQDEHGNSCLHYAVLKNNYGALHHLLSTPGINLTLEDKKNLTPLHLACKYGSVDEADLLIKKLDKEKLFNLCVTDSNPILHMTCRNKTENYSIVLKILAKLKEENNNLNKKINLISKKEDQNRQTILNISVENNHLKIVDLLLGEFKFNPDQADSSSGNLPIHLSAKNGSIEMLNLLIKYNAVSFKANNNLQNALHIAAINNKPKFIKEFLNYEKFFLSKLETSSNPNLNQDPDYIPCACYCDEVDLSSSKLCIREKDKNFYTPLACAIASGNQKCVDELITDKYVDLECKDKDGLSILHICTEFNNVDTLRHLFQLDSIGLDLIYSKDNFDNTILHSSCRNGNLEIIKLIMNKISDLSVSIEHILYSKNHDGHTCFHIACKKGYFNIVEYFLKDKKLSTFLEHVDNGLNTSLHLATENGHSSIVSLLLEHGSDVSIKNEENITALDLSCRLGYFEISKNIINNYTYNHQNNKLNEFPLHTACYEGAYEVVKLLLLKGIPIDELNKQNKNCLEIAIQQGHREVIRVLLEDPNWQKLIRLNNRIGSEIIQKKDDENEENLYVTSHSSLEDYNRTKLVENPELTALFDFKMWDIFSIILDKCVSEKEMDFSIIDPPVKSMSKHPLMMIARSGQENLLKHETTRTLLHLKWRFIPRCAFYFNLIIYMIFMILFSLYSIELSKIGHEMLNNLNNSSSNSTSINRHLKMQLYKETNFYKTSNFILDSNIHVVLIIILSFQLLKEIFQMFFLDGLTYFLSLQNLIELFTYITSLLSLFSSSYDMQSAYASFAVLFAFIVFPLFTQKLKIFGLYVVAFRRTLANSAKFFPIFLIIFTGFILSFRIRSNFDVNYFNSTSYSIIRTLTMVVGEFDTAKMGLQNDSLPNYFIYFMFIGLMCTIVLNLFVGIAVGEIKTVLDEADIQQTSMRIIFVLKVQSALYLFQNTCLGNCLNMQFGTYSLEEENKFVKLKNKFLKNAKNLLYSKEHTIKLSDPQKRLEDSFNEMYRSTSDQIRSIRFSFTNQITDTESRLSNSQRRLQDSIIELTNRTNEQINDFKQACLITNNNINENLVDTRNKLEDLILNLSEKTNNDFKHTHKYFNSQMSETEIKILNLTNKIQNILINLTKKTNFQFESLKEYSLDQSRTIKSTVISSQKLIDDSIYELYRSNKNYLDLVEEKYLSRVESIENFIKSNEKNLLDLIEKFILNTNNKLDETNKFIKNMYQKFENSF